jgi:multiple antibiotic resistance protein
MGWSVLNERDARADSRNKQQESDTADETRQRDLEQKVFYPFTFPITSGPGTLVGVLTVTAHISEKVLSRNLIAHLGVFLAMVILSILVYFCYANAPRITKAIPPNTAHGILRVIAFILLCIGVQIAWNGLSQLLHTVLKG